MLRAVCLSSCTMVFTVFLPSCSAFYAVGFFHYTALYVFLCLVEYTTLYSVCLSSYLSRVCPHMQCSTLSTRPNAQYSALSVSLVEWQLELWRGCGGPHWEFASLSTGQQYHAHCCQRLPSTSLLPMFGSQHELCSSQRHMLCASKQERLSQPRTAPGTEATRRAQGKSESQLTALADSETASMETERGATMSPARGAQQNVPVCVPAPASLHLLRGPQTNRQATRPSAETRVRKTPCPIPIHLSVCLSILIYSFVCLPVCLTDPMVCLVVCAFFSLLCCWYMLWFHAARHTSLPRAFAKRG